MIEKYCTFIDLPSTPVLDIKVPSSDTLIVRIENPSEASAEDRESLPLLSCTVYYKQMYGSLQEVLVPMSSDASVTSEVFLRGLHCGRNYQVYSRCSNRIGLGPISRQSSAATLGRRPLVPGTDTQGDFLHTSNTSVRLDLFQWNEEQCPVSYFVVEYRDVN